MLAPHEVTLLSFRRAYLAVVPMTSDELLSLLPALTGARRLPADPPLSGAVMVAGIEVAATASALERALRSAWRRRRGAGATPLLLLCDEPGRPGSVLALGVLDSGSPLRSIEAGALHDVLQRIAGRPRLEAVRELAAELERLDQAGIPGLELRDLLTLYTLDHRLRGDPLRWQRAREATKAVRRGADWRAVLVALGYELERRQHRGWLARHAGRPVAVVHPKSSAAEFARIDEDGRPPEGVLLNDCAADGAPFGLLVHETRLRLFQADPVLGAAAARYLDLDAGALQDDDWPFLALLGPEYLADSQFTVVQQEARDFGSALRQRLDETIRQTVLPVLARALGRWARTRGLDAADDQVREGLEQAALTLVFRVLFMLYAESSGYLPMTNQAYRRASLTSLVDEAAEAQGRLGSRSTMLWDQLKLLVRAMRNGNPAWSVPAYNGALFAADGFEGAGVLEEAELADPDTAAVLLGLGRDPEASERGVDYSTLEIGHLGHIYEGLLSLRLSVAPTPLRYDSREDRYVLSGPGEQADVEADDLLWQPMRAAARAAASTTPAPSWSSTWLGRRLRRLFRRTSVASGSWPRPIRMRPPQSCSTSPCSTRPAGAPTSSSW